MTKELEEGYKATIELLSEELKRNQNMIQSCHYLLSTISVPSNGQQGIGKRQELQLNQRIDWLIKHLDIKDLNYGL